MVGGRSGGGGPTISSGIPNGAIGPSNLLATAAEIYGTYEYNQTQKEIAKRANKQAKEESARNREFQDLMSSTAYQRAMDDMKKSGLNPMLAFQQGGASSPSGSMASIQSPQTESYSGVANSAVDMFSKLDQRKIAAQDIELKNASVGAEVALKASQAENQIASAKKAKAETAIKIHGKHKAKVEGDFYKGKWGDRHYKAEKINSTAKQTLDNVHSAFSLFNPMSWFGGKKK